MEDAVVSILPSCMIAAALAIKTTTQLIIDVLAISYAPTTMTQIEECALECSWMVPYAIRQTAAMRAARRIQQNAESLSIRVYRQKNHRAPEIARRRARVQHLRKEAADASVFVFTAIVSLCILFLAPLYMRHVADSYFAFIRVGAAACFKFAPAAIMMNPLHSLPTIRSFLPFAARAEQAPAPAQTADPTCADAASTVAGTALVALFFFAVPFLSAKIAVLSILFASIMYAHGTVALIALIASAAFLISHAVALLLVLCRKGAFENH
jgi:hypothetical protein